MEVILLFTILLVDLTFLIIVISPYLGSFVLSLDLAQTR